MLDAQYDIWVLVLKAPSWCGAGHADLRPPGLLEQLRENSELAAPTEAEAGDTAEDLERPPPPAILSDAGRGPSEHISALPQPHIAPANGVHHILLIHAFD